MNLTLNKRLLAWINRYKFASMLVILLAANTYQYMQGIKERRVYQKIIKDQQDIMNSSNKESLEFERERQSKQDELLRELLRKKK